jgi:PIN domain nuclease of toxin-antitoxin system
LSVILDTCALLWWSLDPKEFSQSAAIAISKMEREKNGITPSMSIWEIAIKVKNQKLHLGVPFDTYLGALKQSDVVQIMPVNEDVLVKSVNLQWLHRDPVDRMTVAMALGRDCSIITKDKEIRDFYSKSIW